MEEKSLFKEEDVRDTSLTAIRDTDTMIQRMSKGFARTTILVGESKGLMLAYQAGAKQMQEVTLKALCKDCPCKGDCESGKLGEECESYTNIWEVFNK